MLFFKESKKILLSLTFVFYIITVFAMYFTQFHADCDKSIIPPDKTISEYGYIVKETPEILMPSATQNLVMEYLSDTYTAYPIGFYKEVKLNDNKKNKMAEIITEITGITKEQLDNFQDFDEGGLEFSGQPDENGNMTAEYSEPSIPEINISESLTYQHFRELMRQADKIIGGGSMYSDNNILENFSLVPKTYEEALEEYNSIITKDKITGAYARLFCDYMGIILAIMPVFVSVSLFSMDKRANISQLIYSRKISSSKLILTRYFSLIAVLIIPLIITIIVASAKVSAVYSDMEIDMLAIPKLSAVWLIPNIMFSVAVGMLLTEAVSPLASILVQGILWVSSIMSASGLTGNIGLFTLVCRHNSLYNANLFEQSLSSFIFNRIFYTLISIAMIILAILVYERKRKGGFNGFKKNHCSKPSL